ncbi:hypothetical protein C900_05429 [Fulvivirga imtechensis AK7]|uniref:Uncharacterized protein n=1 Tax=Fulvivirga imtechensis AK7 TaxID=1237149 RepID=L8JNQ4_9BACT|nr:hypothetical protein C900_05429 [Fulvivirga imtechensis AK7]
MTTLIGCKDDDSNVIHDIKMPDGEALQQKYSDYIEDAKQHFTATAENGVSIVGERGTQLTFYSGAFTDAEGNEVVGEVDIELIEIFDKAEMLLSKKTTQGRQEDGSIATLISGGEFFINAKQDGEQLFLKPGMGFQLVVKADPNEEGIMDMQLFVNENEECLEADCDVVWVEVQQRLEVGDTPNGEGGTYYAFADNFGWTNIDRWYSDPRPKTTIFVDVPEGYDNTNCTVYLSYDGEPNALARFDVYDTEMEMFTEHYGLIPIGLEVHFIIVSIVDDQYHYAIQGATIGENHVEVISELAPTTEAELIQLIEDLP